MSDRELLEMAAKAAGISIDPIDAMHDPSEWVCWNPLADDSDALRLAVKLMMSVEISDHEDSTYAYAGEAPRVYACEMWRDDKYAATRRAIVRAAAEIGKAMP